MKKGCSEWQAGLSLGAEREGYLVHRKQTLEHSQALVSVEFYKALGGGRVLVHQTHPPGPEVGPVGERVGWLGTREKGTSCVSAAGGSRVLPSHRDTAALPPNVDPRS